MDDAGAVDRGERCGDPHGQAVQGAAGHRSVGLDGLGQVGAGDVLGDDEERLALQAGVEHAGGGEPGDAAGGGDLPGETAPEVLVVGEVGVDQFHRDLLARGVLREVDRAHAAPAQPADDPVVAELAGVAGAEGSGAVVPV
ncbi:hypothetical protein GCM10009605_45210 [Nocardiopsis composta]